EWPQPIALPTELPGNSALIGESARGAQTGAGSKASGGPSAARALARAPLLRCPQTPSASLSALALGLRLIWGPVQCSPRFARLRPNARAAPPRAPEAVGQAWRLSAPASYSPGGPSAARALARAPLLRCPQTPSAKRGASRRRPPTHLGARPLLARSRALRCSDAPRPAGRAWRLSAPASYISRRPSRAPPPG